MLDTHLEAASVILKKLPFVGTEEYWKADSPICAECFTGGFLFDIVKYNAGITEAHSCNKLHKNIIGKVCEEKNNYN
jgi:hypothetical protein